MKMLLIAMFVAMICGCSEPIYEQENISKQIFFTNIDKYNSIDYRNNYIIYYAVDTQTRLCYANRPNISGMVVDCKNVARIPELSKHITWVTEDAR